MKTTVKDIMAEEIYSVEIFDTIHKAESLMNEENDRHIAVTEKGKLVGIITQKKIFEYKLRELYENESKNDIAEDKILDFEKILKRDPSVVYPEDSLSKLIELMIKKRIDFVPVVDWDRNLIGTVTFTDVLLLLNKKIQDGVI